MKIKKVEYPQLVPDSNLADWEMQNYDELTAILAETGADREMCFDWEVEVERIWASDYRNKDEGDVEMI